MSEQLEIIPLNVSAKGEVLSSNLAEFRASVKTVLDSISLTPETYDEFGRAEQDVKMLKGAEDAVKSAKKKALEDAQSLYEFFNALDESSEEIRQARLTLERKIADQKEKIRTDLVKAASERLDCPARLRQKAFGRLMEEAIKGKRSIKSIETSLDIVVANANAAISANREMIRQFADEHGEKLILDAEDLEVQSTVYVESELRRRVDAARAAEERARLAEEARLARVEADQAKTKLKEQGKPPVPPSPAAINMTAFEPEPVQAKALAHSPAQVGEEEEWRQFKAAVFDVFAQLREAREKLIHTANKCRVAYFANSVNKAWKECEAAGGEK